MSQPDPALERAQQHVKMVRDFFYHLMVFVFVNGLLALIDRWDGSNDVFLGLDWAFWPVLFWGLGLVGHAIYVFFGDYRVQKLYQREQQRDATKG